MSKYCWRDTVKGITDINKFQKDSDIHLLWSEPSDKYTYDDFLYAYDFEKRSGKNFVVSGQILTKMIMPYIYSQTKDDLKEHRKDIIMDCYLEIVEHALPNLNLEKVKTADNPANMLCGYCKLYCKGIISNKARGNVPIEWYDKGYRREGDFSDVNMILSKKIERERELDTEGFLDNRGYYTSNVELKTVEDDIRKKQLMAGIYATVYKMQFSDKKNRVNINQLLRDYDKLSPENRKTVIEYGMEALNEKYGVRKTSDTARANLRLSNNKNPFVKERIVGITKSAKKEETALFLNKFILNLNEKQLDDFIENQHVYDKIQDILDNIGISRVQDAAFDFDYKELGSSWDRLIRNHIKIDYSIKEADTAYEANDDLEY